MLDGLYEQIFNLYDKNIFYMGVAFKFEKGIAIIDKYFDDEIEDGYIIEWTSFVDAEHALAITCKNLEELKAVIDECAFQQKSN